MPAGRLHCPKCGAWAPEPEPVTHKDWCPVGRELSMQAHPAKGTRRPTEAELLADPDVQRQIHALINPWGCIHEPCPFSVCDQDGEPEVTL